MIWKGSELKEKNIILEFFGEMQWGTILNLAILFGRETVYVVDVLVSSLQYFVSLQKY